MTHGPLAGSRPGFVPLAYHASWVDFSTIRDLKCSSQDEVNQINFTGCFGENEVITLRHSPDIYTSVVLLIVSQGSFKAVWSQNGGEQKGKVGLKAVLWGGVCRCPLVSFLFTGCRNSHMILLFAKAGEAVRGGLK